MIDGTKIGPAAAELIDRLEADYGQHNEDGYTEAEIAEVVVLAEVHYLDDDGEQCSAVEWRSTTHSAPHAVGIVDCAREGMLA